MRCPECNVDLKRGTEKNSDTEIDYCGRCKGIWLDEGEIERVCKFAARNMPMPAGAESSDRDCPKCKVPMRLFDYPGTMVAVDMCPDCNGIWVDSGEIKEIGLVRQHRTDNLYAEAIREQAVEKQQKMRSSKWGTDNEEYRYLNNEKKYNRIDRIIKIGVAVVVVVIAYFYLIYPVNGWKRHAGKARRDLKKYYASMPAYEENREYIVVLIDTQHEQVYPECKSREMVPRIFSRRRHSRSYRNINVFDKKKYLDLMKKRISQQAADDKKPELVSWTTKAKI